LLTLVAELARSPGSDPARGSSRDAVLLGLAARVESEAPGGVDGVELLTLHRAKGLEWDAVFIPSLEEGLLPVSQATDDEEALAEERRLLYVGITRARTHLALSWARQRPTATGRLQARTMSRFLGPLSESPARVARSTRSTGGRSPRREPFGADAGLLGALKAWRRQRSSEDGVPAYVVATDATLAAIAERRPRSERELLAMPGIGPARVAKYGDEILAIVEASS
jgi:DNA helicase-2/ATP-dependent DNA helicase PcrA